MIPLLQTKTADTAHTGIFASNTRPLSRVLGGAWGRATPDQRRLDTLTDVHGTPCHVWLARSAWRRLSKGVFVLVLSRELGPVGASYSVRR